MLLFYTGSDTPQGVQKLSEKSLGGYISSTIVPNGILNNLFSTFTKSDVDSKRNQTRVIALTNLTSAPIPNISLYTSIPNGSFVDIKLGVSEPFFDKCGNPNFEKLDTEEASPYYTTYGSYTSISPLVFAGPLDVGASIAIFIQRLPDYDNIPNFCDSTIPSVDMAERIETYEAMDKEAQWNLLVSW
jgi:hypothetical protein